MYLLDTNTLAEIIRRPYGKVAVRVEQVGVDALLTSIIVACELRYGVERRGAAGLRMARCGWSAHEG